MRRLISISMTAMLLVASSEALSPQQDVPPPVEPRWLSAEQLDNLGHEEAVELSSIGDVFVVMSLKAEDDASRQKMLADAVLVVKRYLHQLYYPVDFQQTKHPYEDPAFHATLTDFERRAGLRVDGVFSVDEFYRLRYLAEIETQPPYQGSLMYVRVNDSTAVAEGTWEAQEEPLKFPVNQSEISCDKAAGVCTVFTANLAMPTEFDMDVPYELLTDVTRYEITSWTESQVHASRETFCREHVLTLDAETQDVRLTVTGMSEQGCPQGWRDPQVTKLIPGLMQIQEYMKARTARLDGISRDPARGR